MSGARLFTLEQAQALLEKRVRELAERMVAERAASRDLEHALEHRRDRNRWKRR